MKTQDKKQFFQHLKDGMLKTCIVMLHSESPRTQDYAFLYSNLCNMIIRMQHNIGPIADNIYLEFMLLNVPLYKEKGGVKS